MPLYQRFRHRICKYCTTTLSLSDIPIDLGWMDKSRRNISCKIQQFIVKFALDSRILITFELGHVREMSPEIGTEQEIVTIERDAMFFVSIVANRRSVHIGRERRARRSLYDQRRDDVSTDDPLHSDDIGRRVQPLSPTTTGDRLGHHIDSETSRRWRYRRCFDHHRRWRWSAAELEG